MSKVTVTKKQQEAIKWAKDEGIGIGEVYADFGNKKARQVILDMESNQIAAVWLGVAEIEPEYISFDEAKNALKKGEDVWFYHKDYVLPVTYDYTMCENHLDEFSIRDLVEGKWSYERFID